ncbi:MAG: hypothetical protein AAGH76_14770 [Pseudomonadota bacterium]
MADNDDWNAELQKLERAEPLEGKDRIDIIRDATVFQVKLILDGILDLILVPVSLVMAGLSIATKDDWFYRTLRLGKKVELRINRFSIIEENESDAEGNGTDRDQIDELAGRIEKEIRRELADGKLTASARDSLSRLRQRLRNVADDSDAPSDSR